MLLSSRIRRLREFTDHFAAKHPDASPPPVRVGDRIVRVCDMQDQLRWFVQSYQPHCYWCFGRIDWRGFLAFGEERDPFVIHHIDEDREHNTIDNLTIIHRDCHQVMHKLAEQIGMPAQKLRDKRKEEFDVRKNPGMVEERSA